MPASKLKNLAILILLLANLALLALLIPGRIAANEQRSSLSEALSTLCANQDVSLAPDAIPDTLTLYALELGEDPDADLAAATALLGQQVLAQDDSTRYLSLYSAAAGDVQISRDGTFSAQLADQGETSDLSAAAMRTLKAMGFDVHSLGEPERIRAGVYTLTAHQAVLGDVVQRQQDHHAVVALRVSHVVLVSQVDGILLHGLVSGGIHRLHQDLGAGLGKQGDVHGVDMRHGLIRQHPGIVIDIGILPHDGGGRFPGIGGLSGLADQHCGQNGQHHDPRRHRPFLQ